MDQKKEAIADLESAIQRFTAKNDSQNSDRLQKQLDKWKTTATEPS
jgi:hypothetical protein